MDGMRETIILKHLGDEMKGIQSQLSRLYFILEILRRWDALLNNDTLEEVKEATHEIRLVFLQTFILKLIQLLEYTSSNSRQQGYLSFLRHIERVFSSNIKSESEQSQSLRVSLEEALPQESDILKDWVRLDTFRYSHSNFDEEQKILVRQLLEIILTPQLFEPFMQLKRLRNKWIAHAEKGYESFGGEGVKLELLFEILEQIRAHVERVLSWMLGEKISFKNLQQQAKDSAQHLWSLFAH